jgi:hypothetical protein
MTTQTGIKGHGLLSNFWAQMGLLTVAVIVLIALAAYYIW